MPLSHLLHLCFLNKLRSTKACEAESTVATCSSCWSHRTISPFSSSPASPFADLASSPPPLFSQQTQTGKNFRNHILRPRTNGKKILSLSLKPNQCLFHPHTLFFSETPTIATCSAFPIPHPPLHYQGPPIVPPIFSRLHHFSMFLTESLYIWYDFGLFCVIYLDDLILVFSCYDN